MGGEGGRMGRGSKKKSESVSAFQAATTYNYTLTDDNCISSLAAQEFLFPPCLNRVSFFVLFPFLSVSSCGPILQKFLVLQAISLKSARFFPSRYIARSGTSTEETGGQKSRVHSGYPVATDFAPQIYFAICSARSE